MLQAPQLVFSLDDDENDLVIVEIFTLLHLYLVVGCALFLAIFSGGKPNPTLLPRGHDPNL